MSLHELTRDLHHACERHPFGARMAEANITRQEWADWLWALKVLHCLVDLTLPPHMARDRLLEADLSVLPVPHSSFAALSGAIHLDGPDTLGAAYVLHGAHGSGGRVMAPRLAKRGLPVAHVAYSNPEGVQAWIRHARNQSGAADQARDTFGILLKVMDEIEGRK